VPTFHRDDWSTRAALKGGAFAYGCVKGLVEQNKRAGEFVLGVEEMGLAVWEWARREWGRVGWGWPGDEEEEDDEEEEEGYEEEGEVYSGFISQSCKMEVK